MSSEWISRFNSAMTERLSPHPYLINVATARQVADWAVKTPENRLALERALQNSPGGVFELSTRIVRLKMKDIQTLYGKKASLISPLAKQAHSSKLKSRSRFLFDGTMAHDCYDQELAILHYWTYCDLFHHLFDKLLDDTPIEPLCFEVQRHFITQFAKSFSIFTPALLGFTTSHLYILAETTSILAMAHRTIFIPAFDFCRYKFRHRFCHI